MPWRLPWPRRQSTDALWAWGTGCLAFVGQKRRTRASSRLLTASAPASLPLPAAAEPGVDMTSDVKGREQLFYVCLLFFSLSIGRAGASKRRRLITLISVGWLPPYLHPSGACLILGTRVPFGLLTLPRVTPNRGCASSDRSWKPRKLMSVNIAIFRLSVAREPAWQWPT